MMYESIQTQRESQAFEHGPFMGFISLELSHWAICLAEYLFDLGHALAVDFEAMPVLPWTTDRLTNNIDCPTRWNASQS